MPLFEKKKADQEKQEDAISEEIDFGRFSIQTYHRLSDHKKHLCSIVETGISVEEYEKLVKNGKFVCMECGRVALKEENLCYPKPF
ncbi:MAG: hypothetical protein ACETVN_05880 [Asgard group archaeon]